MATAMTTRDAFIHLASMMFADEMENRENATAAEPIATTNAAKGVSRPVVRSMPAAISEIPTNHAAARTQFTP